MLDRQELKLCRFLPGQPTNWRFVVRLPALHRVNQDLFQRIFRAVWDKTESLQL